MKCKHGIYLHVCFNELVRGYWRKKMKKTFFLFKSVNLDEAINFEKKCPSVKSKNYLKKTLGQLCIITFIQKNSKIFSDKSQENLMDTISKVILTNVHCKCLQGFTGGS